MPVSLCIATLAAAGGCEERAKPEQGAATASQAAPTAPATSSTAAAAAATASASGAAVTVPGALTVKELQDRFKADEKKLLGQKVKVQGLFLNISTLSSGGKKTIQLVIVQSKDDTDTSTYCTVAEKPEQLFQFDPVVVEGTVAKGMGANLEDCTYKKL